MSAVQKLIFSRSLRNLNQLLNQGALKRLKRVKRRIPFILNLVDLINPLPLHSLLTPPLQQQLHVPLISMILTKLEKALKVLLLLIILVIFRFIILFFQFLFWVFVDCVFIMF